MAVLDRISVLRSKNAGPFVLTFDIVLREEAEFERVRSALSREAVARAYAIQPEDVISISGAPALLALKVSIRRRHPAGHAGDSDCYGMNQEEPLARLLQGIAD
jgi:hypothetical protein